MTLDEMIKDRQQQVDEILSVNHCDMKTIGEIKKIIYWSMIQSHSQGKVDYANEDLPEILRNHPGPF